MLARPQHANSFLTKIPRLHSQIFGNDQKLLLCLMVEQIPSGHRGQVAVRHLNAANHMCINGCLRAPQVCSCWCWLQPLASLWVACVRRHSILLGSQDLDRWAKSGADSVRKEVFALWPGDKLLSHPAHLLHQALSHCSSCQSVGMCMQAQQPLRQSGSGEMG